MILRESGSSSIRKLLTIASIGKSLCICRTLAKAHEKLTPVRALLLNEGFYSGKDGLCSRVSSVDFLILYA
jgi:hypothetical protein